MTLAKRRHHGTGVFCVRFFLCRSFFSSTEAYELSEEYWVVDGRGELFTGDRNDSSKHRPRTRQKDTNKRNTPVCLFELPSALDEADGDKEKEGNACLFELPSACWFFRMPSSCGFSSVYCLFELPSACGFFRVPSSCGSASA